MPKICPYATCLSVRNNINVLHNGYMTRHNFFQYSRNDNVILIPLAPSDAVFSPSPDCPWEGSCMHCHCWTRAKWPGEGSRGYGPASPVSRGRGGRQPGWILSLGPSCWAFRLFAEMRTTSRPIVLSTVPMNPQVTQ